MSDRSCDFAATGSGTRIRDAKWVGLRDTVKSDPIHPYANEKQTWQRPTKAMQEYDF